MKKNNNSIRKTLSDINKLAKLLKESYIFDENDMDDENYDEYADEYENEPKEMVNKEQYTDKINQIRSIALEGIQAFASDVDSEEYDFFKKVWLMCDKVCSDKEKNNNDLKDA